MRFQLVLQFKGDWPDDLETLVNLEDAIIPILTSVDGHDIGSGEANIFILTDCPEADFQAIFPLIAHFDKTPLLIAAFREIDQEDYTVIWPKKSDVLFSSK